MYVAVFFAFFSEIFREKRGAFVFQDAPFDVESVIEPLVRRKVVKSAAAAGFLVVRAEVNRFQPAVYKRARAHRARFERHVHFAVRKIPAEFFVGVFERDDFRVRNCRVVPLFSVVAFRDDLSVQDDDRADGNFVESFRLFCELDCAAHKLFIHISSPIFASIFGVFSRIFANSAV